MKFCAAGPVATDGHSIARSHIRGNWPQRSHPAGFACCASSSADAGLPSLHYSTFDVAVPILFPAHSSDHLGMCRTGFDPSRPIVVLSSGAQIAVREQVAGNADLIGH